MLDVFLKTDRARLIVRVMADVMSVVVSSWLTYWSYDYFRYALRVWKESPTLYIPTFYAECSVFVGLVMMTIYAAFFLVKNFRKLTSGQKAEQGA